MEKFTWELESNGKNPLGIIEFKNINEINFCSKFHVTHYTQNIECAGNTWQNQPYAGLESKPQQVWNDLSTSEYILRQQWN